MARTRGSESSLCIKQVRRDLVIPLLPFASGATVGEVDRGRSDGIGPDGEERTYRFRAKGGGGAGVGTLVRANLPSANGHHV